MKTSIVWAIATVTLGLFAIFGWLSFEHIDVNTYIVMLPVLVPAVAALFGVSSLKTTTDTIKTNTNGTLSALTQAKAATDSQLMHALALLTPEQATAVLTGLGLPLATVTTAALTPAPAPVSAPPAPVPAPPAAVVAAPVVSAPAAPVAAPATEPAAADVATLAPLPPMPAE